MEIRIDELIPVDSDKPVYPDDRLPGYDRIEARITRVLDGYSIHIPSSTFTSISAEELWFYPYQWGWIDQSADLEWINHDCPYVRKHYGTGNMQALLHRAYDSRKT